MYQFNRVLFSAATFLVSKRFSHHTTPFGSRRPGRGSVGQKILPPELSRNVVRLTCKSKAAKRACDVYLIGTLHCYPRSVEDVRALVKFLKPQAVFLELCSSRATYAYRPEELQATGTRDRLIKKVFDKFEVESEFQAAFGEAKMYGATIFLGDRPREISGRRYNDKFARMPFLQIMKLGLYDSLPSRQRFTRGNLYNMSAILVNEIMCRKQSPLYTKIWVDERDQYMSATLLELARKHSLVVAVVGKGHLLGIQKYWKQHIKVEQLLISPETEKFNYRVKTAVYYITYGVVILVYATGVSLIICLTFCLTILLG